MPVDRSEWNEKQTPSASTATADYRMAGLLSDRFRSGMRPLTIGTALCVALAAPLVDFVLERHDLAEKADHEAQELASHIGRLEHTSDSLLHHDVSGARHEMEDAQKDHGIVEVLRVDILGLDGLPIVPPESDQPAGFLPPIKGQAALVIDGKQVGTVSITVAERELVNRVLLLLGVFSVLGLVLGVALYFFPLRLFREDDLVRLFAWRSIEAADEERLRLSRDLHDGMGQTLGAAAIAVARFDSRTGGAPEAAECGRLIDTALDDLRSMVRGLRPPSLDDLGLGAALAELGRAATASGVEVKLDIRDLPRMNPEIEQTCFRLAQEALANVVRHAGAAHVRVAVAYETNNLTLEVQDDGCGFSTEGGLGVGLVGARERTARLAGTFNIKSSRGNGTHFKAVLPVGGVA